MTTKTKQPITMASKASLVSTLAVKRSLPKSLHEAAGMLRHHKKALEEYMYNPTKSLDEAAGLLHDRYADLKRHYRKTRSEWR